MNPDLDRLIHLQHSESELKRVESALAELPRRRQESEAALAEERSRLDGFKEGLDTSQKARRRLEGELQDLETKRSRYKGQLMEVKTNKEYTAVLHEIEGVEREIRGREDLILGEMEKAEALTLDVKREEEAFKNVEAASRTRVRELEDEARKLQEQAGRLQADRDAVAATITPDVLARFHRVAKLRGTGVSEARDARCTECHMKMRPQMFVDLKHNEEIVECPQCSRILYYVPVAVPVQP
ncbi:MAG TPA: C4-type zinc ribbon domain-containing protein [Vicinamibacteria bacterium]|nr:C4-type zinc ribbon domain-containing protein [Vicinamibacteria bacterium]